MPIVQAGPAMNVVVDASGARVEGGSAIPVAVVTDGRAQTGGKATRVVVVTNPDHVEGGPAIPVVASPAGTAVEGGPAMRVVVVQGSLAGVSAPVNTALPSLSGTLNIGQLLTTTNGTWTNSPTSFTYQWKRNGVAIGGATLATYTTTMADVGQTLTCTVTATNAGGSTQATSAGSVIFTPSVVSGIVLWVRADSLALADGAAVASWADSSNANAYAQGTGAAQPLYKNNGTDDINGLPVVTFDGSNDTLTKASASLAITTAASVFVVTRSNTATNDRAFFGAGTGGTDRQFSLQQTGTGFIYYENNGIAFNAFGAGYIANGTPYLVELVKNGATIKTYVNQVLKRTDGTGVTITNATDIALGSVLATNFYSKDIAEMVIYNAAVSDADRALIEAYLGAKYGLF